MYVSHVESFFGVEFIVYNVSGDIFHDEYFHASSTRSSASVYLTDLSSTYRQNVSYFVRVNDSDSGEMEYIDALNGTAGYIGRGNVNASNIDNPPWILPGEDLLQLNPVDSPPETCDAGRLGSIYFDISQDDLCQCASGGWEVIRDGSGCS